MARRASISSAMDKMFHGKINDAIADNKLDYSKLSTAVMLFHSIVPKSCQADLKSSRFCCLQKKEMYQLFEKGVKDYENEINIVKTMRQARYNNAVIE